jgi:AraC-like DNA-binding protein
MSEQVQSLSPGSEGDDPQHDADSGRLVRINRRRRDFLAGLPVQESESVQTGSGEGKYRSRRIYGRDLVFMSYSFSPKMVVHTVPERGWTIMLVSLEPQSDLVFNGREVRPSDLCLSTGRDGYMTAGKNRHNIAIAVRNSRLISACAAVAGVGAEDVVLNDLVIPRERVPSQRLHRDLVDVIAQPGEASVAKGQFEMTATLENDLASLLAFQLAPAVQRASTERYYRLDALRVVRTAFAASEALTAPSLADLCAAAGVSQRWLHRCFIDVTGVSPYRYIRSARLSKAREALLAAEYTGDRPPLVKSLALSLGYRLSGRFAADYRSVFGENPSETLARSCQD